jgi:formylglycine-generating enzyme required for sulfatase activity
MEWVTVGNPSAAADPSTGFGSVAYAYRIGKYEVTNAQYAVFLNAVAASDPYGLYNPNMGLNARGGIVREGTDGAYVYTVKEDMGDTPVNYVSWYDAARMANWMTNGQGSGGTESGVYTFDGVISISGITRDLSNPDQVFIPTEDEWYKAAYHQPASQGGDIDGYWLYATGSNDTPIIATATGVGGVANPGPAVVNYAFGADWNGQNGNVTSVGSCGAANYYGAFDMNGNVWEWNETLFRTVDRGFRGGSWAFDAAFLESSFGSGVGATFAANDHGFRLARSAASCNAADLAAPLGELTFGDVAAFVSAFQASDPAADLAPPSGLLTFEDVSAFLAAFSAGCP